MVGVWFDQGFAAPIKGASEVVGMETVWGKDVVEDTGQRRPQ